MKESLLSFFFLVDEIFRRCSELSDATSLVSSKQNGKNFWTVTIKAKILNKKNGDVAFNFQSTQFGLYLDCIWSVISLFTPAWNTELESTTQQIASSTVHGVCWAFQFCLSCCCWDGNNSSLFLSSLSKTHSWKHFFFHKLYQRFLKCGLLIFVPVYNYFIAWVMFVPLFENVTA